MVSTCSLPHVTPEMNIYKTEIFGLVLPVVRADTYEQALELPMRHEYGNGVAISPAMETQPAISCAALTSEWWA